jgi:hypothetical protein
MSVEAPLGNAGDRDLRDPAPAPAPQLLPPVAAAGRRPWYETAVIAAVPLLGLLICVAATRTNVLVPESVRPIPGGMAGLFNFIGFPLRRGELVPAVILMILSYVLAVRYADRVSRRTVIVSVIALNVIVLLAPPLFSTDVFSYQAYAREFAVYHTNPYIHGPNAIEPDLIYNYIGAKWVSTPSVYGPLFTLISAPLAWTSIVFSELTFKIIAALCSAGTLLLIWKTARLRDVDPVRGIALYGLNPMVMLYGVGGGHNDFMMVSLMMWGVYAMLLGRERTGGVLLITGTAIKLTGGILLPFALLASRGSGRDRMPRRFLTGALLIAAVVATASFGFFGNGLVHMVHTLKTVQYLGGWHSVPGFLLSVSDVHVTALMRTLMSSILLSSLVWLLWRVWQRKFDWLDGAAWATFAVLVTAWAMLPWYVVWLMPLVAVSKSRRLWGAAIVISLIAGAMMVADCTPQGIPGIGL